MKRISSRDNPFFRTLRQLVADASARRDAGVAVLEGIHLGDAFLRSGGVPQRVVVGEAALDDAEAIDLLERSRDLLPAPQCLVLDDALFAALSQLAQGVALLMVVERPRPQRPVGLTQTSVLLDRIQDPGNVGSILRSASAAGVTDVYLSRECAGAWSPKVLRAAMGAHFHLRLFEDCDLQTLRDTTTIPWLATSPHAARSIHQTDLRREVAWLFGHEGQGLAPILMRDASMVGIPQPGPGESLNVAASAAICLFEQVRQRQAG